MPLLQVIVLALVQGITEFLPISSSAHLALAPWLLGWTDQGLTFDIALHLGTLVAVLLYFFRDWVRGIDRPAAARFSFLLSTPAIAGAAASATHHLMKQGGVPHDMRLPFILGIAISGASGCAVIAFFLKYLRKNTLQFFIFYRLIFGI